MNLIFFKKSILFLILFSGNLICLQPEVKGFDSFAPKNILMVGNSFIYFNNGMHNPLEALVKKDLELKKNFKIRKITISGASLSWHEIKSYVSNPNIGSFTFDDENNLINLSVEPFDVLIMHDCSRCPINKKNDFHRIIKKHSNDLKEVGIEPVLMMTWPYKDEPKMIEALSNEYIKAANENQILVIPVGLAFAKANEKFSKINLYTSDNRHPSKAGTYLGACVIFSALYKKSPENNPYHFGLEPEIAKNLQKLAWEVTEKFYK